MPARAIRFGRILIVSAIIAAALLYFFPRLFPAGLAY
jgi:hypothetical protein